MTHAYEEVGARTAWRAPVTHARTRPGPAEPQVHVHPDHAEWTDFSSMASLQLLTESVARMIGFEVACLSVVIGEDLVTVAYSGPEEFRDEVFQTDHVSVLDPVIAQSEAWGRFHFLAEEDRHGHFPGHWVVTSEGPARTAPVDAWRPLDCLMAFLHDDDGNLRGVLSVDSPLSERRPDATQRALLERYAAHAERSVVGAFVSAELRQQMSHADAARRAVRTASTPTRPILEVLAEVHRALVDVLGASGTWIGVLGPDGRPTTGARSRDGEPVDLPPDVADLAAAVAGRLWREQRHLVVGTDDVVPQRSWGTTAHDQRLFVRAKELLVRLRLGSLLVVPLGSGDQCVGFLALTRRANDLPWSTIEQTSAREIGHDLGAALQVATALERERRVVRELRQLDDHRTLLIATLSHELRSPLAVIRGNLEVVGELAEDPDSDPFHQAMVRGADRMQKVVDDLLLLTRVSDPRHPLVCVPVDLRAVVLDVVSLVETQADAKQISLHVGLPSQRALVPGDAVELDRLVGNLVSNAVKYSNEGGSVSVTLEHVAHQVVLTVTDTGLGISEEDQQGLFRAFFRSSNPDAQRRPGTGLGLSIVASVAERHGGTIEVDSTLGHGTTFTVRLPAEGP
ncbi:MAG: hypothetical protein CMH83_13330 [Nocardioides sp.]|nr:hypothetical protein [Nocardioides sp.]